MGHGWSASFLHLPSSISGTCIRPCSLHFVVYYYLLDTILLQWYLMSCTISHRNFVHLITVQNQCVVHTHFSYLQWQMNRERTNKNNNSKFNWPDIIFCTLHILHSMNDTIELSQNHVNYAQPTMKWKWNWKKSGFLLWSAKINYPQWLCVMECSADRIDYTTATNNNHMQKNTNSKVKTQQKNLICTGDDGLLLRRR